MKQECSFKATFKCIVPVCSLVEQDKSLHNKLRVISNTNSHERWFREGGPGVLQDILYQLNMQKTTTGDGVRLVFISPIKRWNYECFTVKTLQEIDVRENRNGGDQEWTIRTHRQLWAQDTERRKTIHTYNTTQTIKMMINTDPMTKPGVHSGTCKW